MQEATAFALSSGEYPVTAEAPVERSRTGFDPLFIALWLFVGATSSVDAYLTIKYAWFIDEQNPVGRLLIGSYPDLGGPYTGVADVSLLVGAKMFGTILALGVLMLLYAKWRSAARVVVTAMAAFQFILMCYLLL